MGEAKRRGNRDERVAAAIVKREERERAWNEAQAERRRQRLEAEAKADEARPRQSAGMPRSRIQNRLLLAAVMAVAGMGAMRGEN